MGSPYLVIVGSGSNSSATGAFVVSATTPAGIPPNAPPATSQPGTGGPLPGGTRNATGGPNFGGGGGGFAGAASLGDLITVLKGLNTNVSQLIQSVKRLGNNIF